MNTDKTISKGTSLLLESLEYILKAEESALSAYFEKYGEPEEGKLSLWDRSDLNSRFEDLKRSLKLSLGDFIEVSMCEEKYKTI